MYHFRRVVGAAFVTLLLAACADSPSDPGVLTVKAVAGVYGASGEFGAFTLTSLSSGEVTDWLDAGASISLRLNADGTTEGELFLPGASENGNDLEADLTGTWQLAGNVVTLDNDADTFLRDMPLMVVVSMLEGEHTSSGARVRLTLLRQ